MVSLSEQFQRHSLFKSKINKFSKIRPKSRGEMPLAALRTPINIIINDTQFQLL